MALTCLNQVPLFIIMHGLLLCKRFCKPTSLVTNKNLSTSFSNNFEEISTRASSAVAKLGVAENTFNSTSLYSSPISKTVIFWSLVVS